MLFVDGFSDHIVGKFVQRRYVHEHVVPGHEKSLSSRSSPC